MIHHEKFLSLTPLCTITTGYNRSVLVDYSQNYYCFITNEWAKIIREGPKQIEAIYHKLNLFLDESEIDSFLRFLLKNNLAFLADSAIQPSKTKKSFSIPSTLLNLSISLDKPVLPVTVEQINQWNIEELTLYFLGSFEIAPLFQHLKALNVQRLILYIDCKKRNVHLIENSLRLLPSITAVHLLNAATNDTYTIGQVEVYCSTAKTPQPQHHILVHHHNINLSEIGHLHYANRAHINEKGAILNGIYTTRRFGNIKTNNLLSIIDTPNFQRLWHVKKTDMDDCAHCEFRTICIDERAPSHRKDGRWFSATPCSYNPFISKNRGEKNYFTLNECGIESSATGFTLEMEQFIAIKQKVWGI